MTNKVKQYYTIKVEGTAPVEVTYKILADDEHEAMEMFEKGRVPPAQVKHRVAAMKKNKVKVYKYGTTTLMFSKNC